MAEGKTGTTQVSIEQALKDLYREAEQQGVEILTDANPEIKAPME